MVNVNEVYSPQRVTHTKTSSREDLFLLNFTKTYSILQNHLPEKVPEQFFPHCEWVPGFYGIVGPCANPKELVFEYLWLFIAGVLTFSFFPRLNLLSDTRILSLYPAVPVLMFRFYH